jgi:hypothetical protein
MQHAWCSGVGRHSVLMSVAYYDVSKDLKLICRSTKKREANLTCSLLKMGVR